MEPKIKKTDPLHKAFITVYYDWFKNHVGIKPRIEVSDAAAVKKIIKYFREVVKDADAPEEKKTDLEILKAWEFVFANFEKWDKFYQKQLKLRQIDSNLINILNSIKNAKSNSIAGSFQEQYREIISSPKWGNTEDSDNGKYLPSE